MLRVARVVALFAVAVIFTFAGSSVLANDAQYGPYGHSPVQSVDLDKMVARPDNGSYVDNLSPSDPRFAAGQDVWFRIRVKNPNDQSLNDVTVKDFVPEFLDIVKTPGSYDSSNRTITINAGNFAGQEEKVYVVHARVVGSGSVPSDITCRTNKAQAYNSTVSDEDTSQFCIEKKTSHVTTVTGVTQIPSTGPEMGLGLLALNALGLSAGFYLRKKR